MHACTLYTGFRKNWCKNKVFFKVIDNSRARNSLKNNWTRLPLHYAHLHNVIFLWPKFHKNHPKGLDGELCKDIFFSKKMLSPGAVTPWTIIGQDSLYNMQISTICGLSFYQVSSKSPKGFMRSCNDKVYACSTKMLIPGAITPWKIIGQGSLYNTHISTLWSFIVPSFIQIP
jgi:hypothetical protein